MHRVAELLQPPRRRCPRNWAAYETGITAIAGCVTRHSRSRPSCTSATTMRREPGATGSCGRSPAARTRFRSCTALAASAGCRNRSSLGCPATRTLRPCGLEMPHTSSCRSTYSARSAMHWRKRARQEWKSPSVAEPCGHWSSTIWHGLGASPTRAFGGARRAAAFCAFEGHGLGQF